MRLFNDVINHWVLGLIGAAINSGLGGIAMVIVDPLDFDPFHGGFIKLGKVCLVLALSGAGLYAKQNPLKLGDDTKE